MGSTGCARLKVGRMQGFGWSDAKSDGMHVDRTPTRPTMSLVQYPDSDSDEDDKGHVIGGRSNNSDPKISAKRKLSDDNLPPLPAAFHDLYSTNARVSTSDNPSLHGGRQRTTPHVEGNWPSHVYLECKDQTEPLPAVPWQTDTYEGIPLQSESDALHSLIQKVRDVIKKNNGTRAKKLSMPEIVPSLQSDLGAPLPLHISLSRTLQIKTGDRDDFLRALTSSLKRANIKSFHFEFESLKWVPNFEGNRWFLVLGIKRPMHDELNRLLGTCNDVAESYGFPALYTGGHGDGPMDKHDTEQPAKRRRSAIVENAELDRSEYFHISIAWNLEEPVSDWIKLIEVIDVQKYIRPPQSMFESVKARIGNTVHSIDLGKYRTKIL